MDSTAASNVLQKFEELKSIYSMPKIYLANYFSDLKMRVKKKQENKEKLMQLLNKIHLFENESYQNVLLIRNAFDNKLKQISNQISSYNNNNNNSNLNELNNDIDEIKYKIDKILFSNKSILFDENNLLLILIIDEYLSNLSKSYHLKEHNQLTNEILKIIYLKHKIITNGNNTIIEISLNLLALKELDLESNSIECINKNTFQNLNNLQILNLSKNKISELEANIFYGLFQLKDLNLSLNPKLNRINENSFSYLINLEKLNLEGCDLFEINAKMFYGTSNNNDLAASEDLNLKEDLSFNNNKTSIHLDELDRSIDDILNFSFQDNNSTRRESLNEHKIVYEYVNETDLNELSIESCDLKQDSKTGEWIVFNHNNPVKQWIILPTNWRESENSRYIAQDDIDLNEFDLFIEENTKRKYLIDETTENKYYLINIVNDVCNDFREKWTFFKNLNNNTNNNKTFLNSSSDLSLSSVSVASNSFYVDEKTLKQIDTTDANIVEKPESDEIYIFHSAEPSKLWTVLPSNWKQNSIYIDEKDYLNNFSSCTVQIEKKTKRKFIQDETTDQKYYIVEANQFELFRKKWNSLVQTAKISITDTSFNLEIDSNEEKEQEEEESNVGVLSNLKYLSLNRNKISSIINNSFHTFVQLEVLDLKWNKLTEINETTFNGLINLKELYLDGNKINKIEENAFHDCNSMEILCLNSNELTHINSKVFPPKLRQLFLKENKISSIDTINSCSSHLTILHLENNELTLINSKLFNGNGWSNLKELHLAFNSIAFIEDNSFVNFTSLECLNLDNNSILKINKSTFNGLFNLKQLNLNDNHVVKVQNNSFLKLTNLKELTGNDLIQRRFRQIKKCFIL